MRRIRKSEEVILTTDTCAFFDITTVRTSTVKEAVKSKLVFLIMLDTGKKLRSQLKLIQRTKSMLRKAFGKNPTHTIRYFLFPCNDCDPVQMAQGLAQAYMVDRWECPAGYDRGRLIEGEHSPLLE